MLLRAPLRHRFFHCPTRSSRDPSGVARTAPFMFSPRVISGCSRLFASPLPKICPAHDVTCPLISLLGTSSAHFGSVLCDSGSGACTSSHDSKSLIRSQRTYRCISPGYCGQALFHEDHVVAPSERNTRNISQAACKSSLTHIVDKNNTKRMQTWKRHLRRGWLNRKMINPTSSVRTHDQQMQ